MHKLARKPVFIISAIIMALLVICVPVIKQYHPAEHNCCHNEGGHHHCDCPVCCFQLSTLFLQENTPDESTVSDVRFVYIPLTQQGCTQNQPHCIIIRGPPLV